MLPSTSLLLLDILVELEDGSIANVEIQKIPFTGFSSVVLFTDVSPFRLGTGVLSTSAARESYTPGQTDKAGSPYWTFLQKTDTVWHICL